VAPFAPHLAEELWERLGHHGSIFDGPNWPEHDPLKAREEVLEIPVQVNGRLRGSIRGRPGMGREEAEALARNEENVSRHLEEAAVSRVVWVPDRLVNFVVS
jgi:leucyl-tRNA synthetase